jgi:DNA polymerase III alpha subunit
MSTEQEIIKGIIKNGLEVLENSVVDSEVLDRYQTVISKERLDYASPKKEINSDNWFTPDEYRDMDIEQFLIDKCPKENFDRLLEELQEYHRRNLLPLLTQMKYIVDTLRQNNVVWGVGRGSSVASYVLFLIGIHRVDSVKYDLPIEEFFKGENHG